MCAIPCECTKALILTISQARSPVRQSSLLFRTGSTTDVSTRACFQLLVSALGCDIYFTGNLWPANAAEKALHELEVYKTPLLPTRLKASGTIPDMFLPKKSHQITLMNDDRDDKPRLGMRGKGKKKDKEARNGSKPYAGQGGMKKWLARRRMEEEQVKEKEKADAMEDDNREEEKRKRNNQLAVPPPPLETTFQPGLIRNAHETSSLRVGRTKTTRNHDRPISRRMKKFSAAYEDEDDEMEDSGAAEQKMLEEAAKKTPTFQIPVGFTFAKEVSIAVRSPDSFINEPYQATITHDVTNAKEPPVSSLPFSLTKPTVPASTATLSAEPASKPVLPTETSEPAAVSLAPPIIPSPTPNEGAAIPSTSASAPPPTTLAPPAAVPSGIPNFFATSSVLSKSSAAVASPPSSLTAALCQPTPVEKSLTGREEKASEPGALNTVESVVPAISSPQPPVASPSAFGATASSASNGTSLFGAPSTSTGATVASLFSAPVVPVRATTSLFGPSSTSKESGAASALLSSSLPPPFSFGTAKGAELSPLALAEPPNTEQKETEPPTTKPAAPFGFGLTTPAASSAKTEAPKPAFSFGQPTASAAPTQPETVKTLFGGASAPFSFDAPAANETTKKEEKPASSPFSFGVAPTQLASDAKPASTFSFGETTKKEEKPASSPFSFGGAPQPAGDAKPASAFSFSATTPTTTSTPTFAFGTPSSGSNAADVSTKPFSFAPTTPARPATPPKVEQEVNMDESPTREMNVNGNGKAPERPTLNFSFTAPTPTASALFAQSPVTPAPAFSFGSPTVNPFAKDTKAADNKPKVSFGFGQQSSTGFPFGQKPPESPAATSPGSFSFGQPSPSIAPASPFTFGTPSSNPFGQASATGTSAPPSPSTFNRAASTPAFAFGSSGTTQPSSAPFAFGTSSQPASPANNNTTLPPSSGAPAFTFGASSGTTAPSNVFNTAASSTPAAAGASTLFTIGSAPPPPEGGRQIKKLPRRGGARR